MENAESVISILDQLKSVGEQLSIGDFGTGYSSLSYIHRLPIDTLKTDRSFFCSMENGGENGEIVRTVIDMAKALNLNIVAEGIETVHQMHQLRILGCEYCQEFLFQRPVPADEAETSVQEKNRWKDIMPIKISRFCSTANPDRFCIREICSNSNPRSDLKKFYQRPTTNPLQFSKQISSSKNLKMDKKAR